MGASGGTGAIITGQDTNDLKIEGTPSEINSYLADGAFEWAVGILAGLALILLIALNQPKPQPPPPPPKRNLPNGTGSAQLTDAGNDSIQQDKGKTVVGSDYRNVQKFVTINGEVLESPGLVNNGNPHILTQDGLLYAFEAAGEFVLAKTTQPGDSFEVQVRQQPAGNSSSISAVTQVAARVGSDRVTFGVGRPDLVWVNGSPLSLTTGEIVYLSSGQIVRVSSSVYEVAWNTGEAIGVTDQGSFLAVQAGTGGNNSPGTVVGLAGGSPDGNPANDLRLPDGTVLPQPLTSAQLYTTFANAWRVSQATSLFDYAPGQTTATFTDTNFPAAALTLSDFPANLVAQAAQAVAAAGLTDPGAVAAVELDYLASGEQSSVLANDVNLFQGVPTTAAAVTSSSPPPSLLGVVADQRDLQVSSGAQPRSLLTFI
jgi:von Willebrand factor type D domain